MEAGISEIGADDLLLAADAVVVPAPVARAAAQSTTRETARDDSARRLEPWLGRACVCWLGASLPVVVAGADPLSVLRFALPVALAWLVTAVVAEESSRERRPAYGTVPWAAWLALVGVGLVSAADAWVPSLALPRTELALSALVFASAAALWEVLVRRASARTRRVLVVGSSPGAAALVDALADSETPYVVVGVMVDDDDEADLVDAPMLGAPAELPDVLERERPDIVLLGCPECAADAVAVLGARAPQVPVVGVAELYEHAFGRLPLRHLSPSWFTAALHLYRRPYNRISKRAFDLVVAGLGLVVTAPLLLLVAIFVRQTEGPVIYRQVREGEGGRPFTIYKFRTMVEHAETDGVAVWAGKTDVRITSVGRILRKLRLDELPQLWNVLEGSMSIVGPRPERPELCEALVGTVPHWSRRTILKPGITGWAQINAGYAFDANGAETKLSYDLWYLRHRSLLVDLAICVRTFGRLASGAR